MPDVLFLSATLKKTKKNMLDLCMSTWHHSICMYHTLNGRKQGDLRSPCFTPSYK